MYIASCLLHAQSSLPQLLALLSLLGTMVKTVGALVDMVDLASRGQVLLLCGPDRQVPMAARQLQTPAPSLERRLCSVHSATVHLRSGLRCCGTPEGCWAGFCV